MLMLRSAGTALSFMVLASVSNGAISAAHTLNIDLVSPSEPTPTSPDEIINFLYDQNEEGDIDSGDRTYSFSDNLSISRQSATNGYSSATSNLFYTLVNHSTEGRIELNHSSSSTSAGIGGVSYDFGRGSFTTHSVVSYDESIYLEFIGTQLLLPGGLGGLNGVYLSIRDIHTDTEIFPNFGFDGISVPLSHYASLQDGREIQRSFIDAPDSSTFLGLNIILPEGNETSYDLEIIMTTPYGLGAGGSGFHTSSRSMQLTVVPETAHFALLSGTATLVAMTSLRRVRHKPT